MKELRFVFRTDDVQKIRNFAEDMSLHLKDLGRLPMAEADRAVDVVVIKDIHKGQLRRCRVHVERFLEKHFLKDDCEIIEQDGRGQAE
jgi:hypothetical protein